jgi:hypothetical protein
VNFLTIKGNATSAFRGYRSIDRDQENSGTPLQTAKYELPQQLFKDPYYSLVQSYTWISETDPSCPKNRPPETKHFGVNEPTNRQSRREIRRIDRSTQNNRSEIPVRLSLKTSIDHSDTQRILLALL